ncbi:MAG: CaiB/BaiF CoA-transferase family protein [Bacteroidia bacterium]
MTSIHTDFFKDLKVIELASVLAGPSVGRFFAECGAEVIKVEPPEGGDVTRSWKLKGETGKISAYYASVNAGKSIKYLNIKDASDRLNLDALLEDADVVIMNFRMASAEKLELLPEQLRKKYPKLIIAQLDAFSEEDSRPAYDIVLQAEAGYLSMCGTANSPARLPVAFIDVLAGHQLKEGILMALIRKLKENDGSIVKVNLLESAIGALMNQASNYLMQNHLSGRMGTLHPNIAPYGECFLTSDGKEIVLAVGNDKQFHALLSALKLDALSNSASYMDNTSRVKNREALKLELQPAILKYSRVELQKLFRNANVPYGSILGLDEVLKGDGKSLIHEEYIEGEKAVSLKNVNLNLLK